jgi:hypothetical protein
MMEGLLFITKVAALAVATGFGLTAGMWAFCALSGWMPVTIVIKTVGNLEVKSTQTAWEKVV